MRLVSLLLLGASALLAIRAVFPGPEPAAGPAEPTPAPAAAGTLVIDLADGTDLAAASSALALPLAWATPVSADEALASVEVPDVAAALAALAGNGLVEAAAPLAPMTLPEEQVESAVEAAAPTLGYPDDPYYPRQWHLAAMGAPAGWRLGGGAGVVVAVVDTGVALIPDLPNLLEGASLVPSEPDTVDRNGHGTHVAGTIAQRTNNGVGTAGIAPNASILPIKVLNKAGAGTNAQVAAGIDEAVDRGADVINLSLGGTHDPVVVNAVQKARAAGVIVVAAAGNTGREGIGSPADAPAALAVSALGPDGQLAPYSSWGKGVEIAAPGGDKRRAGGGVFQGLPGGTIGEFQGTSMAAPHVAGAAAVLLGAGLRDPDAVEAALRETADDLGDPLRYGSGALDLDASARKVLVQQRGLLFAAGSLSALGLAVMGGLRGGRRFVAVLLAGVVAGGAFFLQLLPLPPNATVALLARPLLEWPPPFWAGFPLWQSALVPFFVALLLGATRLFSPVALAVCAGVGAGLLHGAIAESPLWWMPPGWGAIWLGTNAAVAWALGLAVAGVARLRSRA